MVNYEIKKADTVITAGTVDEMTLSFEKEFSRDDNTTYTISIWDKGDADKAVISYNPYENRTEVPPECNECNIEISASPTTLDCSGGTVTFKIVPKS